MSISFRFCRISSCLRSFVVNLATGGTAEGIARSLQGRKIVKDGFESEVVIHEFIFLVALDELQGAERLEKIAPVKSLIHL